MAASRMGAIDFVVADVFTDEVVQMLLAKHQEIIQAFLLDALDDSFAARIQVRALHWQNLDLEPFGFEHIVELCRELCVAVANQISWFFVAI